MTDWVGQSLLELNLFKNMNSFWTKVVSAVTSSVISAVLAYIGNLSSISNLDWHQVGGIALIVGASSLLKAWGTTVNGNFVGVVPVR